MPRTPSTSRDSRAVGWLLWLPLPAAVLAVGAVHDPVRAALGPATGILAAWAVLRTPASRGPAAAVLGSWGLALLAWLLSLLALLPAGPGLRAALQPGHAELVDAALALAGTDRHPLALRPDRALAGAGWSAALLALAGASAWVFRTRRRQLRLATVVVATGCAVAIVGGAHRLLGVEGPWGLAVGDLREGTFPPFVSPNHAGLAMAAAVPLAVALALRGRPEERALAALATAVLAAGTWTTASRGAVLEMAAGLVVLALLGGRRPLRLAALAGSGVGAGVVLGVGPERAAAQLGHWLGARPGANGALGQRPAIWADALRTLRRAPWTGVGSGGFEDAWGLEKSIPDFTTTAHAHCDPLQAAVEHGWPAAALWVLAALLPGLLATLRIARLPVGRRRTLGAAWAGTVAAIFLAALYDFPFHVGGLAVLTALALGTLSAFGARDLRPAPRGALRAARGATLGLAVASLASAAPVALSALAPASVLAPVAPWLRAAAAALDDARSGAPGALARAEGAARTAVRLHPLDLRGLLALARALVAERRDAEALAVVDLAVRARPALTGPWAVRARLHRLAGRHEAARADWRRVLALDLPDNDRGEPWVREAIAGDPDPAAAADTVLPDRADRQRDGARVLAELGLDDAARTHFERAVRLDPRTGAAFARFLLDRGEPEAALAVLRGIPEPGCPAARLAGRALLALGRERQAVGRFEAALDRCGADDPTSVAGLGIALARLGHPRAIPLLRRHVEAHPEAHAARRALARLYQELGRREEAAEQLEVLLLAGAATPEDARIYRALVGDAAAR